jgi:hypothetical protein
MTDYPAPRSLQIENQFCAAIRERQIVQLRYKDDVSWRLFAPHAVFHSSTEKVLVTGTQVENPSKPWDRYEPRNFEIGLIKAMTLTDDKFTPDHRFNSRDERYSHGVICAVDR